MLRIMKSAARTLYWEQKHIWDFENYKKKKKKIRNEMKQDLSD